MPRPPAPQDWESVVLAGLPDAVVVIDDDANVLWANRRAENVFGYELADWIGRSGLDIVHPADLPTVVSAMSSVITKDVGAPIDVRMKTTGGWSLMEVVGANRRDDLGALILSFRDVTRRRQWEIASNDIDLFRAVIHNSPALIGLLDAEGRVRAVSGAVTRLLGQDPEMLKGNSFSVLVVGEDRAALESALARSKDGPGTHTTVELRLISLLHPVPVPFELSFVGLHDDPSIGGIVLAGHDITALQEVQKILSDLASSDPLTGLPNRTVIDTFLAGALAPAGSTLEARALAFVDLDGFKDINDTYGHAAGDRVLREVAGRLRTAIRDGDLVARFGGDEFVVGARLSAALPEHLDRLAERLRQVLSEPIGIGDGIDVRIGATIGVTLLREGDMPEDVLARADLDMYRAKAARPQRRGDT